MRTLLYVVFFIIGSVTAFGQRKHVCFSIDDLPTVTYGISDSVFQKQLTDKLIAALKANNIPAIGFVNEGKLHADNTTMSFQIEMLNLWVDNDLELGNHTYSHPDYNSMFLKAFSRDILKGELVTREMLKRNGSTLKYFRHPFLHVGNSKEKSDSLDLFLLKHGYTTAPVTIDNEDYVFALAYKRANDKNDGKLMKQIGADYIVYMEAKVKYFEKQTYNLFGRNIKQILLLHASLLNSDYMDAMAKMFHKNGYDFISMDEALEDEVYKTPVTVFGNWGISWIDRWALSQGKKGDFFKDEPATPDYIKDLSK
jgi:peptidoglycan/xylan/chitin deacetylase (PgdA/CDA1 family)